MPQPEADPETGSNGSQGSPGTQESHSEDSPSSVAVEAEGDPRPKNPYGRERLALGLTLVAVIILFSLPGTITVYRTTLGAPSQQTRFRTCEDGVRALYAGFARKLSALELESDSISPRRPITDPATRSDLRALDDALRSLEPLCAAEGAQGRDAWGALERWRHRTEDNARLIEQNVTPDAERALRYHSPARP